MKAILLGIGLIVSSIAFAAPAAAECVNNAETGTSACVNVEPTDPQNRNVFASQQGVGYASHYAYEYSFWGSTYRGEGLNAGTAYDSPAGSNSVSYDSFCFVAPDGSCMGESRSASVYASEVGSAGVYVDSWEGDTTICYFTGIDGEWTFECLDQL